MNVGSATFTSHKRESNIGMTRLDCGKDCKCRIQQTPTNKRGDKDAGYLLTCSQQCDKFNTLWWVNYRSVSTSVIFDT